jgi:hypothetical protein
MTSGPLVGQLESAVAFERSIRTDASGIATLTIKNAGLVAPEIQIQDTFVGRPAATIGF